MPTSQKTKPRVLMVGIGEVGRYLLEFLVRSDLDIELYAGDIDLEVTEGKINNASIGAALHNRHMPTRALEIDLFDLDRTTALLQDIAPDIVINCAVLQTWHVIRQLPEDLYAKLSAATLGAWLPVQATLAMQLGKALHNSGVKAHYINTSLSDLVNPFLGAMGIAPTIGIGNVALIEPAVRTLVARELDLPRTKVIITMVAHHIHWVLWREAGYKHGAPFYIKIEADGSDVTEQFDTLDLMKRSILLYRADTSFSAVSASSALQNLSALLSEAPVYTHSPGPNGLPGGYPVVLSNQGSAVNLPDDLTLDQAVAMNKEAQQFDGIREIDDDATVRFMPYTVEIMKDVLGFDCESFTPDDVADRAKEQMTRFRELVKRVGI